MSNNDSHNHPMGPQQIEIAGHEIKWSKATISYEEIVAEWNRLSPNMTIVGLPGIDWRNDYAGGSGIVYPGESVPVFDGLIIKVDPAHLS